MDTRVRAKPETDDGTDGPPSLDAQRLNLLGSDAGELSPEAERRATRQALWLGAVFAVAGAAWILVSDAVVFGAADPVFAVEAQRWKGLAFVAATAAVLALMARAGYRRLLHAAGQVTERASHVADLFARHPQAMWLHDPDTLEFLDVNDAAVRRFGWTRAEFLRMTIKDIRPSEEVPRLLRDVVVASRGASDFGTVRHHTKSGETTFSHVTTHAVPGAGRPAIMVMAVDVTPSVRAQEALARQEERFRQLHQSLGEVLWVADAQSWRMLYSSPAIETVYGVPQKAFEDDPTLWLACVHPEDRATAEASVARLKAEGRAECEYRILRPDGSVRWISDRKKALVDERGPVGLIGGIGEDITAARERDEARAMQQARLERMVAERTAELERVNRELDAFTRTAAHDLKSPLNAVSGFSQLLQLHHGEALGPSGRRMAAHIERTARTMEALVNDLLSLSRASTVEVRRSDTDLAELAREVMTELRDQEPQRQVVFEAPDRLPLRCDPGLARSLLANLLGNAWKFTAHAKPATIRLRAAAGEAGLVFTVEDNGTGFDAGDGRQLFKPFQRFHRDEQFGGTGIGLATCQRIVQRHGGALWIESTPGQGTRCHFTLAPVPAAAGTETARAG